MLNKRKAIALAVATAATLAASRGLPAINAWAAGGDVEQQVGQGKVDWTDGIITVTGSGAPPVKGSAAQKRLMTKRAAQADGYRQLAEVISGVHVDSETSVKDFVTESDVIKTSVSALVKGARIVATRNMSDGAVEVDMQAKMYGHNSLFDAVDPNVNRKPGPPPTVQVQVPGLVSSLLLASTDYFGLPTMTAHSGASGVMIDISGLGGDPCMSPTIIDPGNGELYMGENPVDADYVVNEGIAGYYSDASDAAHDTERLGTNPLKLRATAVVGHFHCTAKLSEDDARALLRADRQANFLKAAKVAFIM